MYVIHKSDGRVERLYRGDYGQFWRAGVGPHHVRPLKLWTFYWYVHICPTVEMIISKENF
jgi:hypothetical protein